MLGQSHQKPARDWRLYFIAIILFTPCLCTHTVAQPGSYTDERAHVHLCNGVRISCGSQMKVDASIFGFSFIIILHPLRKGITHFNAYKFYLNKNVF